LFCQRKGKTIFLSCFGLNPNKEFHQEKVEIVAWHTMPKMRGKKYLMHYKMFFSCFNLMKSQLEIRKIVVVVLYRFVHGFNPKYMLHRFDVGASII